MGITHPADTELLRRLGGGDDAALVSLRARHGSAARSLAATYPDAGDPDDLVDLVFDRVRGLLEDGRGPEPSFRAYLLATVRCVAAARLAAGRPDGAAAPLAAVPDGVRGEPPETGDPADRAAVLDAFATLPDRLQAVLWQTEVEGRPPGALGPLLGMRPGATEALVARAREQLRLAHLRTRGAAPPDPGCRPHRPRLVGYLRDGGRDGPRTGTAAHVEACPSCQALVAAVAEAPRSFARAVAPWCAAPADAAAPAPPRAVPGRAVRALAGARHRGRLAAATARGDPAASGTVAVAAALVVALLASVLVADRPQPELAAPSAPPAEAGAPAPARSAPPGTAPADGGSGDLGSGIGGSGPPSSSSAGPGPAPSIPGPEGTPPVDPAAAEPDPSRARLLGPEAPDPTVARSPSPPPPSASSEPVADPPAGEGAAATVVPGIDPVVRAAAASSVPSMSVAAWVPAASVVEVTLVNGGGSPTGFLVVTVEADGGARVAGQPSGCALALAGFTRGLCASRPLAAGARVVVQVPMAVTGRGQSAEVQVCAVGFLRLDCATPLLATTVVALH